MWAAIATPAPVSFPATAYLFLQKQERQGYFTLTPSLKEHVSTPFLRQALIADITGGRFILGLGVSHQPVNQALEIDMPHPLAELGKYVSAVRNWLAGEGPATHIPQRPSSHPVPVYMAANGSRSVELGGELADGIMPFLWSANRVRQSAPWAARGRAKATGLGQLDNMVGLPTFIGDDLDAMRDAARQNLALFTTFPFFQRLFRLSGFAEEADQMVRGAGGVALSDRILDATCLIGPEGRCQEQLAAFRDAGVGSPILMGPLGVEGARSVIKTFGR